MIDPRPSSTRLRLRPGGSHPLQAASQCLHSMRGQSHVVGTVLMIGLTIIALGGLTAAVGGIVDEQTSRADVSRVAGDLDDAIQPVSSTGYHSADVTFAGGTLRTVDREIRVFDDSGMVASVQADALVFEHGNRRVAVNAGAIVRGLPGGGWLERDPPITAGEDVLIVGAPVLNGTGSVGANGGVTVSLTTNTSHERQSLGSGTYRVAIETETPSAFEAFAADAGADFSVERFDADEVPSAVLTFEGTRTGYLVVHDLRLEVGNG